MRDKGKLCECGCGKPTPLATKTRYGNIKGKPTRFLSGHCLHKLRQLVGSTFGFIAVKARSGYDNNKHPLVLCLCTACGKRFTIRFDVLQRGDQLSCGCKQRELHDIAVTTHGLTKTVEYRTWVSMRSRSGNHDGKHAAYTNVRVCTLWLKFVNFLADMGPRPAGTSLSRFGDIGDYKPSNCAWHTPKQQREEARKKRLRRRTHNGN